MTDIFEAATIILGVNWKSAFVIRAAQAIRHLLPLVLTRAREAGCHQLASSLTLTTLLAVVPLITVTLTLASAFPVLSGLTGQIDDFIAMHVLPEQIGKTVLRYVDQFSQRAGRLTLIGLLVLAVTSFMTMLTIEKAFNLIWRSSQPRPFMQRIVVYWAILTIGPVLIGASLTMTSYLVTASMGMAKDVPMIGVVALWVIPFALTIFAFTLLYVTVPGRRVKLRHALIGGIVAGMLFELAKRGVALYVSRVPTYAMVYGTFSAFPIFLIWIYISWLIALLGATVTASLPDFGVRQRIDAGFPGGVFCEALLVLVLLGKSLEQGRVLHLQDVAAAISAPLASSEALLDSLSGRGWVGRMDNGGWVLLCSPEFIRISDIAKAYLVDAGILSSDPSFKMLSALMIRLQLQIEQSLSISLLDVMRSSGKETDFVPV